MMALRTLFMGLAGVLLAGPLEAIEAGEARLLGGLR